MKKGATPDMNPYHLVAGGGGDKEYTERFAIACGYSHESRKSSSLPGESVASGLAPDDGAPKGAPPRGAIKVANLIATWLDRTYMDSAATGHDARSAIRQAYRVTNEEICDALPTMVNEQGIPEYYGGTGALIVETDEELILSHLGDWCVLLLPPRASRPQKITRPYDISDGDELARVRSYMITDETLSIDTVGGMTSITHRWPSDRLAPEARAAYAATSITSTRAFGFSPAFAQILVTTPEMQRIPRRDVMPGSIFVLCRKRSEAIAKLAFASIVEMRGRGSFVVQAAKQYVDRAALRESMTNFITVFFSPWAPRSEEHTTK